MKETEFDKFADEYQRQLAKEIKASGEGPEFFAEYKIIDTAQLLTNSSLNRPMEILDFGSGIGNSVPYFKRHFPTSNLTCVDVSRRSLEIGENRFPGQAKFESFDGETLPFDDNIFDIVFAACVFHHIDQSDHVHLIKEIHRVLMPGGRLIIFEHNPYNPLTRNTVNNCVFDENAVLIPARNLVQYFETAGFASIRKCYRIFFPHIVSALRVLEPYLGKVPLGAQYYVVGEKPKST